MSSPATRSRPLPFLVAVLGLLLAIPFSALLTAAPAHATASVAEGSAVDALGDPVGQVTVEALAAPAYSTVAASTTTDDAGAYALPLAAGTYHLRLSKVGYATTFYGGDVAVTLVMDADGDLTEDGEPVLDNLLADVTMTSTATHPLTGTVKGAGGAALAGIDVGIYASGDTVTPVDTATTDGAGGYALEVPAGVYEVHYSDPGSAYLPTSYGGATPAEITVEADGNLLADGVAITCPSLCDVTMTLPPPGTEYPIAGQVLDANADPVDGISVSVVHTGASGDSGTGTTGNVGGEHGRYSVSVLPGTYHVTFSGTGFVSAPYTGDGGTGQATITVASNGVLSVSPTEDLVDNQLNATVLVSVPYTKSGTVVKAAAPAEAIAGITVRAFPAGDHLATPVDEATTDGSGDYSLSLPIGSYDLQYVDEVADGTDYVVTWLGGDTPSPLTVGQGGALTYLDATVPGIPEVQMAVPAPDATYDVSGTVVDAVFDPIDDLVVTATPTGATPGDQAATATTGEDPDTSERGTYHLLLEAGTYQVSVDGGAHFADSTYPGSDAPTATITVQPNGVVLVNGTPFPGGVLDPVQLTGTTAYPLTGRATDGTTGLPGLSVKVYAEDDTTPGNEVATTTTGVGGSFTANVIIGSYVLQLSGSSGGQTYSARWSGTGPTGTPVQMGQSGAITIGGDPVAAVPDVVMTVAGSTTEYPLTGSAVDNHYDPLAGVLVTAVAKSGGAVTDTATTDVDGLFQLDVRPGTYEVSYAKSGYPTSFYLDPEGILGTEHAQVVVELDGTMRIHTTVITGGVLESQVMTNPATKHPVSGTVLTEAAAGLSGITVQALVDGSTDVAATTTSGVGGAYTLQLPVGTYNVRFTDNDVAAPTYAVTYLGGDVAQVVKVATGGQVSVDDTQVDALPAVTMTEVAQDVSYDLKGFAYDEQYEYFDDVAVAVLPVSGTPAGNAASGTTGADSETGPSSLGDAGVYRIPVHPGKYRLRFTAPGHQTTYLASFDDLTKPVTVTVAANGVITAPGLDISGGVIDDVQLLLTAPSLVTAPRLTGKVAVGQTVTTTLGTWRPAAPVEEGYTYVEWFLDGKPADSTSKGRYYEKLTLPAGAVGKKLTYRLVLEDPETLRAPAVFTSKAVVVAKAASTVAGSFAKGKLKVTVKVAGVKKPLGKITVLDGKKKVGKATLVARSKGIVVLTLKLKPGKHKLTIVYAGTGSVAGAKKVLKIKV